MALSSTATRAAAKANSNTITKYLTSPSRVANALDWKKVSGAVLSLHVNKDSIDLAVTNHPTLDTAVQPLPSIPLKKQTTAETTSTAAKSSNARSLHPSVAQELQDICNDWQVCGFVVSWPVQKEGGRCGAPCGRVLHTLDRLVATSSSSCSSSSSSSQTTPSPLFSKSRPICLWDARRKVEHDAPEDEWGRTAANARTSDKSVHYASVEQYQDDGAVAADIAADYMRHHFPELNQHYADLQVAQQQQIQQWGSLVSADGSGKTTSSTPSPPVVQFDLSWLDAYEQTDAYCARAAL